jgi:hypothetical protein
MTKQGLKARDTDAAKEIVNTITKEVDKVFPEMETIFNKSTKQEKDKFLDLLNKSLFEGDISKPINPKSMDDIVKQMDDIELDPQSRQKIVGAIDRARSEFTTLVGYLDNNIKDKKNLKPGLEELQELLKGRMQGWVGSTYKAFEPRSRFFKAFQRYKPTDEAYSKTINLFMRYLSKTDPIRREKIQSMRTTLANQGLNEKQINENITKQFFEKNRSIWTIIPKGTEYYHKQNIWLIIF